MENLQHEVISQILKYISFEDRIQLSNINKNWHYGSLHPKLIENDYLTFNSKYPLCTKSAELKDAKRYKHFKLVLLNTKRSVLNLRFYYLFRYQEDITRNVIPKIGICLKSLHLSNLNLLSEELMNVITNNCTNLKVLKLTNVRYVLFTKNEVKPLLNVHTIYLEEVEISNDQFNILMNYVPNLKNIGLIHCEDSIYYNRDKSIYIDKSRNIPYSYPDSEPLTEEIVERLTSYKNLTDLKLTGYYNIFTRLSPHIKLTYLCIKDIKMHSYLSDIEKLNLKNFYLTLGNHLSIEVLKLKCCPLDMLTTIISRLTNLVSLTIWYDVHFELIEHNFILNLDKFGELLSTMKKLKKIKIVSRDQYFSTFLLSIPVDTIKQLTSFDCSIYNYSNLVTFGTNLRHLRVKKCIMTIKELQVLCQNLTKLEYLCIEQCPQLNDATLKSISISNLKELVTLKILGANLSYKCIKHIQLPKLNMLYIDDLSHMEIMDLPSFNLDIEITVKKFGQFVPSLKHLEIRFKRYRNYHSDFIDNLCIFDCPRVIKDIKSYFKNLEICKIY